MIRLVVSSMTTIMAIATISFHYDDGRDSQSVVMNIMAKLCKKRSFKRENKLNDTNNPNSDSDVQPTKQEWPDKKERKIDYIRYADTIDSIVYQFL